MNDKEFSALPTINKFAILKKEAEELATIPMPGNTNVTVYIYNGRVVEEYRCGRTDNLLRIDFLAKNDEVYHRRLYSMYISIKDGDLRFGPNEKKKAALICCCCNYAWYVDGKTKMVDLPPCPMCEKRWYKFERTV